MQAIISFTESNWLRGELKNNKKSENGIIFLYPISQLKKWKIKELNIYKVLDNASC